MDLQSYLLCHPVNQVSKIFSLFINKYNIVYVIYQIFWVTLYQRVLEYIICMYVFKKKKKVEIFHCKMASHLCSCQSSITSTESSVPLSERPHP